MKYYEMPSKANLTYNLKIMETNKRTINHQEGLENKNEITSELKIIKSKILNVVGNVIETDFSVERKISEIQSEIKNETADIINFSEKLQEKKEQGLILEEALAKALGVGNPTILAKLKESYNGIKIKETGITDEKIEVSKQEKLSKDNVITEGVDFWNKQQEINKQKQQEENKQKQQEEKLRIVA